MIWFVPQRNWKKDLQKHEGVSGKVKEIYVGLESINFGQMSIFNPYDLCEASKDRIWATCFVDPLKLCLNKAGTQKWQNNNATVLDHHSVRNFEIHNLVSTVFARHGRVTDLMWWSFCLLVLVEGKSFAKKWWCLGPFASGKVEYDGDPLVPLGGIQKLYQEGATRNFWTFLMIFLTVSLWKNMFCLMASHLGLDSFQKCSEPLSIFFLTLGSAATRFPFVSFYNFHVRSRVELQEGPAEVFGWTCHTRRSFFSGRWLFGTKFFVLQDVLAANIHKTPFRHR